MRGRPTLLWQNTNLEGVPDPLVPIQQANELVLTLIANYPTMFVPRETTTKLPETSQDPNIKEIPKPAPSLAPLKSPEIQVPVRLTPKMTSVKRLSVDIPLKSQTRFEKIPESPSTPDTPPSAPFENGSSKSPRAGRKLTGALPLPVTPPSTTLTVLSPKGEAKPAILVSSVHIIDKAPGEPADDDMYPGASLGEKKLFRRSRSAEMPPYQPKETAPTEKRGFLFQKLLRKNAKDSF
jgi:hypothetical protein